MILDEEFQALLGYQRVTILDLNTLLKPHMIKEEVGGGDAIVPFQGVKHEAVKREIKRETKREPGVLGNVKQELFQNRSGLVPNPRLLALQRGRLLARGAKLESVKQETVGRMT